MEIKTRYSKAERDEIRADIATLRARLERALFEKRALPAAIVNGTLSQVRQFKDVCEQTAFDYFVKNTPGASLSGRELLDIKGRLENYAAKIHA